MARIALLAVDDRPDNLFVLRVLLQEHLPECEVFTATSGAEGLQIATNKILDGILLDVQMPEMDGIEMCKRLKSNDRTRDIPVILLTAHESTPELRAEGLEAGAEDFIGKPIHNLELVARVRVMVRIKHAGDQLRSANMQLEQQVTERIKEQWESEERFRFALKNSDFTVFTQDSELKYTWIYNPPQGLTVEGVLGKTDADFVPAEGARILTGLKRRVLETGIGEQAEVRIPVAGEPSFHLLSVEPLFDTDGNVVGLSGASTDITDRRRAEDERDRLASVVEQVAVAVAITDAEGKIEYVNPAFEILTGFSNSDARGQQPGILLQGERYNSVIYQEIWQSVRSGRNWQGRLDIQAKDSSQRETQMTVSPLLDAVGEIINYVFLSRDITHELELESQLRQSQKLDALGTLAGGIAHDFNNILGAIIGYTELAKDEILPQSQTDRYLKEVLRASTRAKELIRRILTFTRTVDTERKAILPDLIVKETLQLLRASIPSSIEMVQEIEPDLDAILADQTQIHQIIMNLCTNAYQAMSPAEGILTVKLHSMQPSELQAARFPQLHNLPCIELTVSDTGCGMEREIIDRIFDPFFTTKQQEQGTGLGLSTVHGIVQSLDGAISVSSEPGKGSTFSIYLPTIRQNPEERHDIGGPTPAGQGEHILLVDDEEALRESCRLRLDALGYKVTTCKLASEALQLFELDPLSFDLVLTDYAMPKMNGVSLARELLRIRPDISVVLVTGFDENVAQADVEDLALSAFLKKPLDADLLGRTMWAIFHEKDETGEQVSSDS